MSESPDILDVSAVASGDWPMINAPRVKGRRREGFQAIYKPAVLDDIRAHGKETTQVEVCGVLVGNVFRDENGPYLYITHAIRGDAAANHATQVTFTAETWQHIQSVMDREHPNEKIVGWYHTHPGFDIFLSGMDLFIQDNFFNLPWQVAFVYDPIGEKDGNFVWRSGKSEIEPYLVEEAAKPAKAAHAAPDDHAPAERKSTSRISPVVYLVAFVAAFLSAYFMLMRVTPSKQFKPAPPSPALQEPTARDLSTEELQRQMIGTTRP